jgi:hypothetical protein
MEDAEEHLGDDMLRRVEHVLVRRTLSGNITGHDENLARDLCASAAPPEPDAEALSRRLERARPIRECERRSPVEMCGSATVDGYRFVVDSVHVP